MTKRTNDYALAINLNLIWGSELELYALALSQFNNNKFTG